VFWVVDNGSCHRGQKAIDRLAERLPNAVMVHTPVHASWLNQVEVYFSIVQRKLLSPNDFTDLDVVQKRLTDFEARYNHAAQPFKWKFTTSDLADLLERLDRREQTPTTDSLQPRASLTPDELTNPTTKLGVLPITSDIPIPSVVAIEEAI